MNRFSKIVGGAATLYCSHLVARNVKENLFVEKPFNFHHINPISSGLIQAVKCKAVAENITSLKTESSDDITVEPSNEVDSTPERKKKTGFKVLLTDLIFVYLKKLKFSFCN